MKDDSNKPKSINDEVEYNLSYYFSSEMPSSTESQNQKQLKAVQLYTADGYEHSQGEGPCALSKSVEFDYEEEPVERDLQCCFCDEISSDCDLCGGPHTDFVYPTGAEDCIDYCGVCGDVGCALCLDDWLDKEPLQSPSKPDIDEPFNAVNDEPLQAPETLLARAKSQFKTSVREALEKPSVFVCEALRLVLIPFIVSAMIVLFSRAAGDAANDTITNHANEFFSVVTLIFGFLISIKAMKTFQPVVLFGLSAKDLFKVLFMTKPVFFMTVIVKYLLPVFFFIIVAQIGFYLEAPVAIMALVVVTSLASVLFLFDDLNGFKLSEQIAVYKSRYNVQ